MRRLQLRQPGHNNSLLSQRRVPTHPLVSAIQDPAPASGTIRDVGITRLLARVAQVTVSLVRYAEGDRSRPRILTDERHIS